ncbi:2OG-Fe(II) oxygenase [Oligoflexaceae bacterium]|nr:2OG-Fe(II) oxygenase [Oligoflexaceae bacterium]
MPSYVNVYPNTLDEEFCASVVETFQNDHRIQDDPQPDYSRRKYLNLSAHTDWLGIVSKFLLKTNELAEDYFSVPDGMEDVAVTDWIDDGFIMSHYRPGDDLILHFDGQNSEENYNGLRLATVLFFLSTCEGGELYFPFQDLKIAPVQGTAVVFPPGHTHPHQVLGVETDRFAVQTWLTHPEFKVVSTTD